MGSPDSLGDHSPILILFDGVCNLCNRFVQFLIKRDRDGKFRFASLQSNVGRSLLIQFDLNPNLLHSIVVINHQMVLERSDAALYIAKHLGGPWKLLTVFKILPRNFRDSIYNVVSANRYRIFGKRESCMIPTPQLRERFIE